MWKWLYGPILVTKVDRLGTYAAALAYYFVLSMIPFLVLTFAVGSQLAPDKVDLGTAYKDLLNDILPGDIPAQIPQARGASAAGAKVENNNSVAAGKTAGSENAANLSTQIIMTLQSSQKGLKTIGFILAIYTSFNLMEQIVRTLLFIFDDHRKPHEWSLHVTLKSIALLAIWMMLLLLISIISVLTPVIESVLKQMHLDSQLWTTPLLAARDLVLTAALFGAFFLTYYMVPSKRYRLDQIRNGSIVATLGWGACSLIFAYVMPNMWHMNAVYKALGSVVVILLWAQSCAWSVIVGACWIVRFSSRGK